MVLDLDASFSSDGKLPDCFYIRLVNLPSLLFFDFQLIQIIHSVYCYLWPSIVLENKYVASIQVHRHASDT